MKDVECPYCGKDLEINHDDGYGYEESEVHEQECCFCEKTFHYWTTISFDHSAEKAPCKNGEPHNWVDVKGCPKGYYENLARCSYCQEERKKDDSLKYDFDKDCWG